jgi:lactoylglutathione lyase
MIRVLDEQRSVVFYKTAFDLDVAARHAFDGFTLLYLANAEASVELELTVNHGREEPYALGDGYGHLAVVVEDIASEHARFEAAGLNPGRVVEFLHQGSMFARFFFVADPDGYKIEVLQKTGRFA